MDLSQVFSNNKKWIESKTYVVLQPIDYILLLTSFHNAWGCQLI